MLSVVLTTYPGDYKCFAAACNALRRQTCRDFEVIAVVKGSGFDPYPSLSSIGAPIGFRYSPDNDTMGDRERQLGLWYCERPWVAFLSADNLVYPDFVARHVKQLAYRTCCVSVVNIDYYRDGRFDGVYPKQAEIAKEKIDLTNFALPTEVARRLDCFGDWCDRKCSDWDSLDRVLADGVAVAWDRGAPPCAAHF